MGRNRAAGSVSAPWGASRAVSRRDLAQAFLPAAMPTLPLPMTTIHQRHESVDPDRFSNVVGRRFRRKRDSAYGTRGTAPGSPSPYRPVAEHAAFLFVGYPADAFRGRLRHPRLGKDRHNGPVEDRDVRQRRRRSYCLYAPRTRQAPQGLLRERTCVTSARRRETARNPRFGSARSPERHPYRRGKFAGIGMGLTI